jgi:MFS-type transporter involved in bile tolerance (Atg22 family)
MVFCSWVSTQTNIEYNWIYIIIIIIITIIIIMLLLTSQAKTEAASSSETLVPIYQILCSLTLSDITSNCRSVATFVTVTLQAIFHT